MGIIARQSIKASLVGFVGVGIGAISRLFIATKFLTEQEIGLLDVVSKLVLILITFFMLGAPQVIKKYYAKYKIEGREKSFLFIYVFFTLICISLSSSLYFLFKSVIADLYVENSPLVIDYILLPMFCTVAYVIFHILNSISIVNLRIVVPTILNQLLVRVLGIVIILAYGYFAFINQDQFFKLYLLSFFAVPGIGMLFYVYFVIKPKFKKPKDLEEVKTVFKETKTYNLFLILSAASTYIVMAIDAQMIGIQLGLSSAGIYGIAFYMGNVIELPKKSIGNISYPILTKAFENNNLDKIENIYQQSSIKQFFAAAFMFVIIWINLDLIFKIIPNGEIYSAGKYVVLFIGVARLFDMFTGVNKQIIEASSFYRYNLYISVTLSILVIVLNLIFIPIDHPIIGGINGAAFASFLAIFISNLVAVSILKFKLKLHLLNIEHFYISALIIISFGINHFFKGEVSFLYSFLKSSIIGLIFLAYFVKRFKFKL